MKIRHIEKQFNTVASLGFKNLMVSGCSFTYNNSDNCAVTWPYYLRDLGGFDEVFDCSMVGGGNQHIVNSLIYSIETSSVNPEDTLIIVQWAGHDRDDYIVAKENLNDYPFEYQYQDDAFVGVTGGQAIANFNDVNSIKNVQAMKNRTCRSIENFVRVKSLQTYLKQKGFTFVFFEYRDYSLPGRDNNFDPKPWLHEQAASEYQSMMTEFDQNFYKFCLKNNLMEDDDFHPSPDGHLAYTKTVLLPNLKQLLLDNKN